MYHGIRLIIGSTSMLIYMEITTGEKHEPKGKGNAIAYKIWKIYIIKLPMHIYLITLTFYSTIYDNY